jgi:hypothetical protein
MSDRLIKEGALGLKKKERIRLAVKAEGLIGAIKTHIQHASVVPLRELETGIALELMKDLHETRTAYLKVCEDIAGIEKDLG